MARLRARGAARARHGAISWPALSVGLLVLTVVAVGVVNDRGLGLNQARITASGQVVCTPTAERPGPRIDLGVQAATGEPDRPSLGQEKVDRLVGLAAGAGASIISTTVSWRAARPERGDPYDFTALDRVVSAAVRLGVDVKVQLVGTPDWAQDTVSDGSDWRPPLSGAELERWSDFVSDVLRHVETEHGQGAVDLVEVWSKPNEPEFWSTGTDPAAFVRLLQVSYDAVRAVDPEIQVVSGGLSGGDVGYLERVYDALEARGSAERPFDFVGVYPLRTGSAPDEYLAERAYERAPYGTYDENFLGFRELHRLMVARGDGDVPIYIGQFGYSTERVAGGIAVSDEARADHLVRAFEVATCAEYVEVMSWYSLHPTREDPAFWTLVDARLRPNETYRALQRWSVLVRSAQRSGVS